MDTPPKTPRQRNTQALFARVAGSNQVIVPINDSALNRSGAKPHFYCVHDVTGAAGSDYVLLARHMDETAGFFGIQAPPSRMRDAKFGASVESIAEHYVHELVKFQPEGAFYLGGFSGGAIVALEISQRLLAVGREVALLAAIDAAPENTATDLSAWHPEYLVALARNLPAWISHGGLKKQKDSHSLLRRLARNALAVGKAAIGLKPAESWGGGYSIDNMMDLSRYPSAQRAFINRHYASYFSYSARDYSGGVVVYEATVRPLLNLPQYGSRWRRIAPHAEVVELSGSHLEILREPLVIDLARDLCRRITHSIEQTMDQPSLMDL